MADAYDLKGMQQTTAMLREIVNLQIEVDTLKDLLARHGIIPESEFTAARNYIASTPKYKDMITKMDQADAEIRRYQEDPKAYLQYLFNRKMQGKD